MALIDTSGVQTSAAAQSSADAQSLGLNQQENQKVQTETARATTEAALVDFSSEAQNQAGLVPQTTQTSNSQQNSGQGLTSDQAQQKLEETVSNIREELGSNGANIEIVTDEGRIKILDENENVLSEFPPEQVKDGINQFLQKLNQNTELDIFA